MNLEIVALVAAALLALAVAFQIGLALGAPWGAAAYGGRAVLNDGVLPVAYRCASGVAALTLLGAMWVVLASASLVARGPLPGSVLTIMLWCLTGVLMLNTAMAKGSYTMRDLQRRSDSLAHVFTSDLGRAVDRGAAGRDVSGRLQIKNLAVGQNALEGVPCGVDASLGLIVDLDQRQHLFVPVTATRIRIGLIDQILDGTFAVTYHPCR